MLFNSLYFLAFLAIVFTIHYLLSAKLRWYALLIASIYFYSCWSIHFVYILVVIALFNYFSGQLISRSTHYKSAILYAAIALNILILGIFKFNGFWQSATDLSFSQLILPVGMSFYTLQNIGYLFGILKFDKTPENNFLKYLFYLIFFPKIIAGPVEQAENFLPRITNTVKLKLSLALPAFQRIVIGFFCKIVLADRLSPIVNEVFKNYEAYGSPELFISSILFSFQLYFDFAGYTHIALGVAHLFGYNLTENFNRPYAASSVSDYWRRWHISLTTWFKNHIYFPFIFQFRSLKKLSLIAGIWITFLISGIWHGLGWNFLVWSILHGTYLVIEILTKNPRKSLKRIIPAWLFNPLSIIITFFIVSITKIFFKAENLTSAFAIFNKVLSLELFSGLSNPGKILSNIAGGNEQILIFNLLVSASLILLFIYSEAKINKLISERKFNPNLTTIMLLLIVLFGVFGLKNQFIYMQF